MMPSVEIATKIAEALEVSLDFLVGNSSLPVKDKNMLERLEDIAKLPATKQMNSLMSWMLTCAITEQARPISKNNTEII